MTNNSVYKGYRLSAIVRRHIKDNRPSFTATLIMVRHEGAVSHTHGIPEFMNGGAAATPSRAVEAAILHGRKVVDSMSGPAAI